MEVRAPFVFDAKHGIALHAMKGNRSSSRSEGQVSWFFSSCGGNLAYILELRWGWPFKTRVSSATSGLLSTCKAHLVIILENWQGNKDTSGGEAETQGPFPVAIGILVFLSIFKRSQASSPFEALNSTCSTCLSSCERDVRAPFEMRRGTMALSRVSTGDSDIPSSWEMQDKPAFKSLQGNPALF